MLQRMMLFAIFSCVFLLVLTGCGVERPDTNLYVVNAPGGYAKGYNMKRDYDANGQLKPDAKAIKIKAEEIYDLNKFICTDPTGFANLKAYVQKMREAYKDCQ